MGAFDGDFYGLKALTPTAPPPVSPQVPPPAAPVATTPDVNALTPDSFKARIMAKMPNGVAADGTSYAQMDAKDMVQRFVSKYPDAVTNDGHKYSDFLGAPAVSETQAADQASQKQFGSVFGANTNDTGTLGDYLKEGAKTVANVLPSAFNSIKNFGKSALSVFGQLPQNIANLQPIAPKDIPAGVAGFAKQVPNAAYQTLVPEAARKVGEAVVTGKLSDEDLLTIQRDITNDLFGQFGPVIAGVEGAANLADAIPNANAAADFQENFRGKGFQGPEPAAPSPVTNALDTGMKGLSSVVTKPAGAVLDAAGNLVKGAIDVGKRTAFGTLGQAIGVKPGSIEAPINNPEAFTTEALKGPGADRASIAQTIQEGLAQKQSDLGITPETLGNEIQNGLDQRVSDLSETGSGYNDIRSSGERVTIPENTISNVLNKYGLTLDEKGKIQTSVESVPMKSGDIDALQNFIDQYGKEKNLSGNAFLNARKGLSNLAQYDAAKSDVSNSIAKDLRSAYDAAGKEQLTGLKSTDADYSTQIQELKSLKTGLVDKQGNLSDAGMSKIAKASPKILAQLEKISPGIGERIAQYQDLQALGKGFVDQNGDLTESATNKIANAGGVGKDMTLARLEEISPGITDKLQLLKTYEDYQSAGGIKTATYGKATAGLGAGALGGMMFGVPGALIFSAIEQILTQPNNAIAILRQAGLLKNSAAVGAIMDAVQAAGSKVGAGASAINNLPGTVPASMGTVFGRK